MKRQRDCIDCGAAVGIVGREHCCYCTRKLREQAAKAPCPGCGLDRVLVTGTGRCKICSHRCGACGAPVRRIRDQLCRACRRRTERIAQQQLCPRCHQPGYLRDSTGWCGPCSRSKPPKQPPRVCVSCGQLRRHVGRGLCSPCWQRHGDRPFVRGDMLTARLADPPPWLADFVAHLAARHCSAVACRAITELGRLLDDDQSNHPQPLLERSRQPGRSMGPLARALEDFFTDRRLAMPTDQIDRLATGRRQRRIESVPEPLRSAVAGFGDSLLRANHRARRTGTKPRNDHTIDTALATIRDLAIFVTSQRRKHDWATVDVGDVEAFLADPPASRARRLTWLRQFFRFARTRRLILIDPTADLTAKKTNAVRSRTITVADQQKLLRRWTTDPAVHPHEALVGMLALLHATCCREARLLRVDDIDHRNRTVKLGDRPQPVPLDPSTWAALHRCLQHRDRLRTDNPHVIVTRATKARRTAASAAYLTHVLDDCGYPVRMIRITRLVDLVNLLDPKLVAAAFGMDPHSTIAYLADHIDSTTTFEAAGAGHQ